MLKKTIITDAKYYNPTSNSFEILNLAIAKKKIIGLGYLPDDDNENTTHIQAKNHYIVPHIFNLWSSIHNQKKTPKNNGICSMLHIIKEIKNSSNNTTLFIPDLALNLSQLHQINHSSITIITTCTFSEMHFMHQEIAKSTFPFHFHFILTTPHTTPLNQLFSLSPTNAISYGLLLENLQKSDKQDIIKGLEKQVITSLSSQNEDLFIDQCLQVFEDDFFTISHSLFTKLPKQLFYQSTKSISLLSSPSFSLIHSNFKKANQTCLATIENGMIYSDGQ